MLAKKLMGAGGNLARPWSLGNSYDFGSTNSTKYFLLGSGWSGGNPDKWTFSAWVKLTHFTTNKMIFTAGVDVDDYAYIQINSAERFLYFTGRNGGTDEYVYTNKNLFTAGVWYHVVVAYDPTQAINAAKCALYINNQFRTAIVSSTPTTIYGYINENITHAIGTRYRPGSGTDSFFRGKMADIHFIDGEYLSPSAFAYATFGTNVWTPKEYTGSYGATGFRLNFENATSATTLGYDVSGNGHNATPYNIVTSDVSTDLPG
jgi:hypothetical protein